MDCRTFNNKLEDYLQGGLDFAGRFGMERHAQQCFACGKVVSDAQALDEMARRMRRVSAPPNFEAELLARIQADCSRDSFWRMKRYWLSGFGLPLGRSLAGASALILAAFGVFYASRTSGGDSQQSPPPVAHGADSAGSSPSSLSPIVSHVPASPPATESAGSKRVLPAPVPTSPARYSVVKNLTADAVEAVDSDYVEYLVPGPDERPVTVRLPKTIRMQFAQPSEEYFIRNVSH